MGLIPWGLCQRQVEFIRSQFRIHLVTPPSDLAKRMHGGESGGDSFAQEESVPQHGISLCIWTVLFGKGRWAALRGRICCRPCQAERAFPLIQAASPWCWQARGIHPSFLTPPEQRSSSVCFSQPRSAGAQGGCSRGRPTIPTAWLMLPFTLEG